MNRPLVLASAAALGTLLGGGGTAWVQDRDGAGTAGAITHPQLEQRAAPSPASVQHLLLAWTPGRLPDDLDAVAIGVPGVSRVVTIRGGPVALVASADHEGKVVDALPASTDWQIAIDTVAIDPAAYAEVVGTADRTALAAIQPGEGILGATSARVRGVRPGALLRTATGATITVAAVVPDEAVGGAELAVDLPTGAAMGVDAPRALVVIHEGDRGAVEAALVAALPPGVAIRFRAPGETPFLRAGDGVLPPAAIKDAFGEFAYRVPDPGSRDVEIDPAWVEANIVGADIPVLGHVTCHRAVLPALIGAMAELGQKNLATAVVTYDGCWVPRLVGPGESLSRHAWGVAVDLNYLGNPTGTGSTQDPRLVEVMERWGFTWGGRWLEPDPAHFEYVAPPR